MAGVYIYVVRVVVSHSLPLYSVSPHLRRTQISLFTLSYSCQPLQSRFHVVAWGVHGALCVWRKHVQVLEEGSGVHWHELRQ